MSSHFFQFAGFFTAGNTEYLILKAHAIIRAKDKYYYIFRCIKQFLA